MKAFSKTRLSLALVVCVSSVAAIQSQAKDISGKDVIKEQAAPGADKLPPQAKPPKFLSKKFEDAPEEIVSFSSAKEYTPLESLQTVEYSEDEEKQPKRIAHDMTAVAITPKGRAKVSKVTAQDIKIFENAVDMFESDAKGVLPGASIEQKVVTSPDATPDTEERSASKGSEASLESVIGTDERIRVYGTTYYPWRTVGRIDTGCTGTLIGPRHVLTAGHCVYNINTDQWYSNLSFSPGQSGSYRPYGKISWSRVISVRGWTRSHSSSYDYAMIVLSNNIGYTTGWLGYGYKDGLWSMNVNVAGYPSDKPWGTMWREYCPMNTVWYNSRRVTHTCDTYKGMSGSGLYLYKNGSRTIYAVHTNGSGGGSTNSGTRINSSVFNNLKSWKSSY